jgi:hypothetical protein
MEPRLRAAPQAFDLDRELARLERRLGRELDGLPPRLRELTDALPALLGKEGSGTRWVDRFAPLTLLYPLLHAEALDGRHLRAARALVLPQALLVLHAFLDDRRRDGQLDWSAGHQALDAWLLERALVLLSSALGHGTGELAQALLLDYIAAQETSGRDAAELAELAVRRHFVGFVATRCLLEAAAAPDALVEAATEGFRGLALGLQWVDDFDDLAEDLASGAPNLLLDACGEGARRRADLRTALAELLRSGTIECAFALARSAFGAARDAFAAAGLPTLARFLEERLRRVDVREGQWLRARAAAALSVLPGAPAVATTAHGTERPP